MTQVLIIDRDLNPAVWAEGLHWCDSSGTRSVWYFNPDGDSYETALDLPDSVFEKIQWHVNIRCARNGTRRAALYQAGRPRLRDLDPEIDQPIKDAGQLPDGCIPFEQSTATTA